MPIECALIELKCPLCGSAIVSVTGTGEADRAICPVCWASALLEEVRANAGALRRGSRIEPRIKRLVDQTRFPRPQRSAESQGS